MPEFKTIETQEELDRIIQDRLSRQKEKYADYDELKSKNTDLESQLISMQEAVEKSKTVSKDYDKQIAELNTTIVGYKTASLRTRIALQNGLPIDLADRLVGEDEASIKADAERLAGFVSKPKVSAPLRNPEPPIVTDDDADLREMLQKLNEQGE